MLKSPPRSTSLNVNNEFLKSIPKSELKGSVQPTFDGYDITINSLVAYKDLLIRVDKLNNTHVFGVVVVDYSKYRKSLNKEVSLTYQEIQGLLPIYPVFKELKELSWKLAEKVKELNKKISILLDKILVLQSDLLGFTEKARQQTNSYLDSLITRVDKVLKVK